MRKYHFLIALIVVVADRASKWLVARSIPLHDSVNVLPGVLRLTHVQNSGAAFGLFAESPSEWKVALLILFSMLALVSSRIASSACRSGAAARSESRVSLAFKSSSTSS